MSRLRIRIKAIALSVYLYMHIWMKRTVVIQYTVPAKCYSRKTKDISKNIPNYVAKDPKYITQTLKNNHKK